MVCIPSRTGRRNRSARSRRPDQIPRGIPISREIPTATNMRASVSMPRSHRPSRPMSVKPTKASSAMRHPANRPDRHAAPTMTPRNVMRDRRSSTPDSRPPSPLLIGSKT